ncbi:MAG: DsrE family protein [Methanoregula sp.]|nr:DsrE family protein [Methanoregula sp.]
MTSYFFLLSTLVTQERLSWIEGAVRSYFHKEAAGRPGDAGPGDAAGCAIFLTDDALYSLSDAESLQTWSAILSLARVRIICDREALDLRGISPALLRERFPHQVIDYNNPGRDDSPSFWTDIVCHLQETIRPVPPQIGWLETTTPYMFHSAANGIRCLSSALDVRCGVSLYAYLDGCHICHSGQNPDENEKNTGAALEELGVRAAKDYLPCTIIASRHCAGARGYNTWDDGQGTLVSSFTLRPAHVRDLDVMIDHIRNVPVLLSGNAGFVHNSLRGQNEPGDLMKNPDHVPPVIILVTHSPYSTEYAKGGIAFAAACAHQGIRTNVVFLEDGVFALAGEHRIPEGSEMFTIPDLLALLAHNKHLHFSALAPSFQRRGVLKNPALAGVTDIGFVELANLLFTLPDNAGCSHKRIIFF